LAEGSRQNQKDCLRQSLHRMVGLRSGDALRAASPHALCSHSRNLS
jgi:hypothetical protein